MSSAPGPSAPLSWWPLPGSALDAIWSRETLAVVSRVWRSEGLSLYWAQGTEALRDDLQGWLLLEAMEFRQAYRPDAVEQRGDDDELATWCRVLYRVLAQRARWHFTRVTRVGLSPEEARQVAYSTDSIDRPVSGSGHGGQPEALGEALGGTLRGLWPRRVAEGDPADLIVLAEEMSEKVAALEDVDGGGVQGRRGLSYSEALERLDDLAPNPGAGQCSVWGCWRPARKGRTTAGGLCQVHYAQDLAERAEGCEIEGCGRPVIARGLCTKDWQRMRKAERAVVAEAEAIARQAADDWLTRCECVALRAAHEAGRR